MSVTWDVSEINRLAVDLAVGAVRIGAPVAAIVRKSAANIERDAKMLAPVGTGRLRDSISTTLEGDGRSASMSAEIGPTVDYGEDVEYGTSDTPPQPYMGPAFEKNINLFVNAMELAADRMLEL